jgi:hypothetical protein
MGAALQVQIPPDRLLPIVAGFRQRSFAQNQFLTSELSISAPEVPDPKIEEDGRDAVIKVTGCAICGSDLHIRDYFFYEKRRHPGGGDGGKHRYDVRWTGRCRRQFPQWRHDGVRALADKFHRLPMRRHEHQPAPVLRLRQTKLRNCLIFPREPRCPRCRKWRSRPAAPPFVRAMAPSWAIYGHEGGGNIAATAVVVSCSGTAVHLTSPNDLRNAAWVSNNTTSTNFPFTAPDGTSTASEVAFNRHFPQALLSLPAPVCSLSRSPICSVRLRS